MYRHSNLRCILDKRPKFYRKTVKKYGWLGMLHPNLEKQLGFDTQVFLFELDQNLLLNKRIPVFKSLSKYPSVRRDLALIVKEEVSASEIINCIKGSAEPCLARCSSF